MTAGPAQLQFLFMRTLAQTEPGMDEQDTQTRRSNLLLAPSNLNLQQLSRSKTYCQQEIRVQYTHADEYDKIPR